MDSTIHNGTLKVAGNAILFGVSFNKIHRLLII